MTTKIYKTDKSDIEKAGEVIRNGGLVAFPTETVYGLGANALDENAVKNIYKAKGRPSDNPLIVHIGKKEDIIPLVKEVTPKAKALMDKFFPGALTIILKKSDKMGNVVSGGLDTVAVRMPSNPIANSLILSSGVPIAAPSANTSGLPSPTKAKYVMDDMMGKIDGIIDGGDCEYGVESTVITLATPTPMLLRPGAVTKEMIEDVIGKIDVSKAVLEKMDNNATAPSPGMKYKHYAPKAKVIIVDAPKEKYEKFVNRQTGAVALCFDDDNVNIEKVTYGKENDDLSQAKELFDALRKLDEIGAKKVYARIPHKDGVGMAVYNRLIRAAAFMIIDLNKPFLIGLTGQTGAGKGYVGKYLEELGFRVLDTDIYARKAVENNAVLEKITEVFGNNVVKNGVLDRKALAKAAFADDESVKKLNDITHPAILSLCEKDSDEMSVLDAPLLYESGADKLCYKKIAVIAPEDVRLERIIKRDNITKKEAIMRMNRQKNEEYYISKSDFTIKNDGGDIKSQIMRILEAIL